MSPDISNEVDLTSYKFKDSNECVIVNFYVNGAIEQKDIQIFSDIDNLEIITPGI